MGRDDSLAQLMGSYSEELNDCDDSCCVHIGVAVALLSKKELRIDIAANATEAIDYICTNYLWSKSQRERLLRLKAEFLSPENIGAEAKYARRTNYKADWAIGDTFAHALRSAKAEALGIKGHYVLMRKVGEYQSFDRRCIQLLYITICPPNKLPRNSEELRNIGFLPMLPVSATHMDYLAQLEIKKKSDMELLELTKIGCFPDAGHPDNQANVDHRSCRSIFRMVDEFGVPDYELDVCLCYKKHGIKSQEGHPVDPT